MKKTIVLLFVVSLLISCTSKKEKAIQYNKSGIRNMFNLKDKEAMEYFNLAIEMDSTFDQPHYYRANLKYGEGDYQGALTDYNKAIALNPKYAEAYSHRGNVFEKLHQQDNACKDFQKAHDLGEPNLEDKLIKCE